MSRPDTSRASATKDLPDHLDLMFGTGRRQMKTGEHVEVWRESPAAKKGPPHFRKRINTEPQAEGSLVGTDWNNREILFVQMLGELNSPRVQEFYSVGHSPDRSQKDLLTLHAGPSIENWLDLPVRRGDRRLTHVFHDCAHWFSLARCGLEALQHINNAGALHLDIKPDNICVPTDPATLDPKLGVSFTLNFSSLRLIDFAFSLWERKFPLEGALGMGIYEGVDYQSKQLQDAIFQGENGNLKPTRLLDWRADLYGMGWMLGFILEDLPLLGSEGAPGWNSARDLQAKDLVKQLKAFDQGWKSNPAGSLPRRPHQSLIDGIDRVLEDGELQKSLSTPWQWVSDEAWKQRDQATPATIPAVGLRKKPGGETQKKERKLKAHSAEDATPPTKPPPRLRQKQEVSTLGDVGNVPGSIESLGIAVSTKDAANAVEWYRKGAEAGENAEDYLLELPGELRSHDKLSTDMSPRSDLPHAEICRKIDNLIGKGEWDRCEVTLPAISEKEDPPSNSIPESFPLTPLPQTDEAVWMRTKAIDTIGAYQNYWLTCRGKGHHVNDAEIAILSFRMKKMGDDDAWIYAKKNQALEPDVSSAYLKAWPNGKSVILAKEQIDRIFLATTPMPRWGKGRAWYIAKERWTVDSFQAYLIPHPNDVWGDLAELAVESLSGGKVSRQASWRAGILTLTLGATLATATYSYTNYIKPALPKLEQTWNQWQSEREEAKRKADELKTQIAKQQEIDKNAEEAKKKASQIAADAAAAIAAADEARQALLKTQAAIAQYDTATTAITSSPWWKTGRRAGIKAGDKENNWARATEGYASKEQWPSAQFRLSQLYCSGAAPEVVTPSAAECGKWGAKALQNPLFTTTLTPTQRKALTDGTINLFDPMVYGPLKDGVPQGPEPGYAAYAQAILPGLQARQADTPWLAIRAAHVQACILKPVQRADAKTTLERVIKEHPGTEVAQSAQKRLALWQAGDYSRCNTEALQP